MSIAMGGEAGLVLIIGKEINPYVRPQALLFGARWSSLSRSKAEDRMEDDKLGRYHTRPVVGRRFDRHQLLHLILHDRHQGDGGHCIHR